MIREIGLVGSPSTTARVTVDVLEDASGEPLHGQLVSLTHSFQDKHLIALGTVTEILTRNRWHEDPNMRGVLKRHGRLPHLSEVGDVRTAEVLVQAAYAANSENPSNGDPPIESGGSLTMSPTTGATVQRVTDEFLRALLRRHKDDLVFLGRVFKMEDVRLPLVLRHFGSVETGGAGEAYHSGVFGMTGSGKSVFAAYLLAAQLRHPELAVVIMDPQGQFTTEEGLPFSLQEWAELQGRNIQTYSISDDLKLPQDAYLLTDLLSNTRFFRDLLSIRAKENRESAEAEFTRALQRQTGWDEMSAGTLLRAVLADLAGDQQAIVRIYASPASQKRLQGRLNAILGDQAEFDQALEFFDPLHSLFTNANQSGGRRHSLFHVLEAALDSAKKPRAFIVLNFSSFGPTALLESTPVKARILRVVCRMLNQRAEELYQQGRTLNTLVVFDEAQRFAANDPEDDESRELAERLVDYVRTTRKYGLGWMFITQEIGSLRRGIYTQLRVRSFGYGLTSGTELQRLRETIGDPSALELYRSFVDPQAVSPRQYPFMLTGPVSPLSFTGAPVFLSVYTDFDEFKTANGFSNTNR